MARTRRSLYSALAILLFVVAALLQQAHGQGFGSPGMEDEPPPEEGQEPPSTDSQDAPPEDPPSPPPSPPPARPPRRFPPPPSPFPPPPPLQSFASRTQAIVAYLQPFSSRNGLEACNTRAKQMSENTFAFFRANLPLYYRDMTEEKTIQDKRWSGWFTITTLQGDAHMSNMGSFSNSKGDVVYDLNDFDEGFVGNYLLDVYRLAISMVLVARDNGLPDSAGERIVRAFAANYTDRIWDFWNNDKELTAATTISVATGPLKTFLQKQQTERGTERLLSKWTDKPGSKKKKNERRVFETSAKNPDLEPATEAEIQDIRFNWPDYIKSIATFRNVSDDPTWDPKFYDILDIARRVNAGLSSIGIPRFYVLVRGPTAAIEDDVILDVKLQRAPVAQAFFNVSQQPTNWWSASYGAERVPRVQATLLPFPDQHLGFFNLELGNFSVRELNPYRESYELTGLPAASRLSALTLEQLAAQYGKILAANHARGDKDANLTDSLKNIDFDYAFFNLVITSDDFGDRDQRIANFVTNVAKVALQYATKYEADRALFKAAHAKGDICKPVSSKTTRRFARNMLSVARALRVEELNR